MNKEIDNNELRESKPRDRERGGGGGGGDRGGGGAGGDRGEVKLAVYKYWMEYEAKNLLSHRVRVRVYVLVCVCVHASTRPSHKFQVPHVWTCLPNLTT